MWQLHSGKLRELVAAYLCDAAFNTAPGHARVFIENRLHAEKRRRHNGGERVRVHLGGL